MGLPENIFEDYQIKTIKEIRAKFICTLLRYSDYEIANAYNIYCELFYAAGWTNVDLEHFVKWATTPPIEEINAGKKSVKLVKNE